ncbi:hypothetical protein WJX77_000457 [Trebouxia sp. C0004]
MPVESAIWVTGASSLGLVGGTLVCTLLGAALFARGFAQDPTGMEQRTEQSVGKRRRRHIYFFLFRIMQQLRCVS